ncbi:MAG TPA: efflux RND transporter periplasmic adaptor subunit [Xanthobacteraceae bacterium]|nr:efflux RND transporter periplasmic adaptor subunit [Xanthobacteraceae bacterium]
MLVREPQSLKGADSEISSQSKRAQHFYHPTDAEWATLTVEPVQQQAFRTEHVTEGKIAVDEDRSTPIFSPYAGRVTKLLARPGDSVTAGQALFTIEATDMVQAQNDFRTAIAGANKARSQLNLAQIVEKRNKDLYEGKAVALKEWQQSQNDLTAAQNDLRSAETALEAARNRLRILGRTDEEITAFQEQGRISAETTIFAPIAGTIVQRKVGPGQFVNAGASDPVFVIGDLSTVWLTAYVRETEAGRVRVGEDLQFTVLAYPDHVFTAKLNYVATALDPTSRRLLVRATIDNPGALLKPEMFANVGIFTEQDLAGLAVPREALIYEGSSVRIWVVHEDKTIELRQIKTGLTNGRMIQVLEGINPGERVITRGSLFIDRAASAT